MTQFWRSFHDLELVLFGNFEKIGKLGKFCCHFVWDFTSMRGSNPNLIPSTMFLKLGQSVCDVAMTFPGLKDALASTGVTFSIGFNMFPLGDERQVQHAAEEIGICRIRQGYFFEGDELWMGVNPASAVEHWDCTSHPSHASHTSHEKRDGQTKNLKKLHVMKTYSASFIFTKTWVILWYSMYLDGFRSFLMFFVYFCLSSEQSFDLRGQWGGDIGPEWEWAWAPRSVHHGTKMLWLNRGCSMMFACFRFCLSVKLNEIDECYVKCCEMLWSCYGPLRMQVVDLVVEHIQWGTMWMLCEARTRYPICSSVPYGNRHRLKIGRPATVES